METGSSIQQNLILASLPEEERFRVARIMEPVELAVGSQLVRGTSETVYFPVSGIVSIVATLAEGSSVETGALGTEGWIGCDMFGGMVPAGTIVLQQIAGSALRTDNAAFRAALGAYPAFAGAVTQFRGVLLSATIQTAACNRLHEAVARCARWLLFTRERVGRDDLAITHQFLAQMLGASRSAVSATMAALQREGLVEASRAHVTVIDAAGLARVACECHAVLTEVYARYRAREGRPRRAPMVRGDQRRRRET